MRVRISSTNELNIESKKKSGYQTGIGRISTMNLCRDSCPNENL